MNSILPNSNEADPKYPLEETPPQITGGVIQGNTNAPTTPTKKSEKTELEILDALTTQMQAFVDGLVDQPPVVTHAANRVMLILIAMNKSIQNLALAQAGELTTKTKMIEAYGDLQTQIPMFLKGTKNLPSGIDLSELNAAMSIYLENIRTNKGVVEDEAKATTSLLNTTKERGDQFSNMLRTFIDQASSAMSKIFRR